MTTDIVFTREQHLGLITLHRPQALNALTLNMIQALQEQLEVWKQDHTIHAVVIRAEPGKAFCAGGDVRWLYEEKSHHSEQMRFFWHEYRLNHSIHHLGKPYIAFMDGLTMGGGVGIALHGSHPVASERFVFAMPETSIGFFPDIGASHVLSRCPGEFGVYLALTGNRVGAFDAKALGLVRHVIPSGKMNDALHTLIAADLSMNASEVIDACLQPMAVSEDKSSIESQKQDVHTCFQYDDVQSIMMMLSQREENWYQETYQTLAQKAPLSLIITLAQMRKAALMNLAECLNLDYCLAGHFMRDHDFYEGVRALLVDKDKKPRWQPDKLAAVTAAQVADYFEYIDSELPITLTSE